jgi:DNA-binding response OmpR family regulator
MSQATKILLIDDDPAVLLTVGDRLRLEGYEVIKAASGDQALILLRTDTPDLIVLDVTMPGMTGLAFLKKISAPDGRPRYPVLVFTARSNMGTFFSDTAVEGFLAKTADPQQLIDEIRRILARTHMAPGAARKGRRRLLLVEDDPHIGMQLNNTFTLAGFDTTVLCNSSGLIEAMAAKQPDAVLIKEVLPHQNGTTAAKEVALSFAGRRTPVIVYDDSGLHKREAQFPNVDRFVASRAPAELLKAVVTVTRPADPA